MSSSKPHAAAPSHTVHAAARTPALAALALLAGLIAGCSGSSARSVITGPVGTSNTVALSSSTGTTQLQQGAKLDLAATVANDTNNKGVTWTLVGPGTLSAATTTKVTYTAPTGVTGIVTPVVIAVAVADTTQSSQATLVVLGKPVIPAITFFPGNEGTPYNAAITVSGGLSPYTWKLNSGTLPDGVTLSTTATTAYTTLSGTPTKGKAAGTYNFQVQATDTNKVVVTADLTLVINAAEACLLNGHYATLYTGFAGTQPTVGGAAMSVNSSGTVAGYQDYSTSGSSGKTSSETLTGTCTTRTANNGTLAITGTAWKPQLDYAVTTALDTGRVQLMNGGDSTSASGLVAKQDTTAFNLTALAGSYAFGLQGVDGNGAHMGLVGAMTLGTGGVISSGHADASGANAAADAALTGDLGAPDANGRGLATLSVGSQNYHFAYYIVDANRLLLVSIESAASGARLAGEATRQAAGGFGAASLSGPAVMSLWGRQASVASPLSLIELARLSNANAVAGTVDLVVDTADRQAATFMLAATGAAYTVRTADGRTTLSYTNAGKTRSFVAYLDGPSNGYVLEPASGTGNAGVLEAQTAGPFSTSATGLFVAGTQYAQDAGPIVLLPSVHLSAGSISSTYASGYFGIDLNTGRAAGTFTVTGVGTTVAVLYQVTAHKMVLMQLGTTTHSAALIWLGSQ